MKTRARVKRLAATPEVLVYMCTTGTGWKVEHGVPEGARFRGVTIDPTTQILHFFVEHESFEEIDIDSQVTPQIETLFKRL